jgi:hypothetical protein
VNLRKNDKIEIKKWNEKKRQLKKGKERSFTIHVNSKAPYSFPSVLV